MTRRAGVQFRTSAEIAGLTRTVTTAAKQDKKEAARRRREARKARQAAATRRLAENDQGK